MDRGLIGWLALALIAVLLGGVAYWFSRRTYRLTAVGAIVLGCAAVTVYGNGIGFQPANYLDALQAGGNALAHDMLGHLVPGLAGWLALLVLAVGLLAAFDTLATRRQQPGVQVGDVPEPPRGPEGAAAAAPVQAALAARRALTEELKFRLPAVQVRAPASMPGGSRLESLATVVSDSGVQGAKVTAAVMLAVRALEAKPRTYQVNTFVEHCRADGTLDVNGKFLQITVDLRDVRTGQSLAARVLRPCPPDEAAEMVAGFTARQVFREDVTTPDWAVGSLDGEDLSAYLLTREMRPAGRTYADLYGCRQRQRERLEDAVCRSTNSGLVQYELAAIYDLDGQTMDSLALNLENRLLHPRFLRARYRVAMSLSMLAGETPFAQWLDAGQGVGPPGEGEDPASVRADIIRKLRWAGMLRGLTARELSQAGLTAEAAIRRRGQRETRAAREQLLAGLLAVPRPAGGQARLLLLLLAHREFAAYRRRLRATALLWCALRHRAERAASLDLLRSSPAWWRHPRRRLWATAIGQEIVAARLCLLTRNPAQADQELAAARQRVRQRLGLGRTLDEGRPWPFGVVPWQAVYNAACLYALPAPGPQEADDAVQMLRLAISDPACELDRPSEWISADPDLRALRGHPAFDDFIREQARRDFLPATDNSVAGPWLASLLPTDAPEAAPPRAASPGPAPGPAPVKAAAKVPPQAGGRWFRAIVRPRPPAR